jgi:hypothetical protein
MAFDTRHRDKSGEISRKHGNTLIGTLRKHYGQGFAKWCRADAKLSEVLQNIDEPSLSRLIHDHDAGNLDAVYAAPHSAALGNVPQPVCVSK